MRFAVAVSIASLAIGACGRSPVDVGGGAAAKRSKTVRLSVVGTADVHGHIEQLPLFGGYLSILRERRDGVVLVDAGDIFQGTLASNLLEGEPMVLAYNELGYSAAAVGNHEFDFGPVGERSTAGEGDDRRGALKARAAQAAFPFLAANIIDESTSRPVDWPNVRPSALLDIAGVSVGVVGVSTMTTPVTTIADNFEGLAMQPLADAINREASALRRAGAEVVVVAAHAGGRCSELSDPRALDSCEPQEIGEVAGSIRVGLVDVIVAGHTHQAIAHWMSEIPVVQGYHSAISFSRVDLEVSPEGEVSGVEIHPPRNLCEDESESGETCAPLPYEGATPKRDPGVLAIARQAGERARELADRELGVVLTAPFRRSRQHESAVGNLFVDLMLAARPDAQVALTNGGGLRADLPAGPLRYGHVYELMPFENRYARVVMTGDQLARVLALNLTSSSGILSLGGARATARCGPDGLRIDLVDTEGQAIAPDQELVVVTSDFLATGGDGLFTAAGVDPERFEIEKGMTIRDSLASALRQRGGELSPENYHGGDGEKRRVIYPGERPVRCQP